MHLPRPPDQHRLTCVHPPPSHWLTRAGQSTARSGSKTWGLSQTGAGIGGSGWGAGNAQGAMAVILPPAEGPGQDPGREAVASSGQQRGAVWADAPGPVLLGPDQPQLPACHRLCLATHLPCGSLASCARGTPSGLSSLVLSPPLPARCSKSVSPREKDSRSYSQDSPAQHRPLEGQPADTGSPGFPSTVRTFRPRAAGSRGPIWRACSWPPCLKYFCSLCMASSDVLLISNFVQQKSAALPHVQPRIHTSASLETCC